MKKILTLIIALLPVLPAVAQKKSSVWPNKDAKKLMIGLQGGATTLHGDANDYGFGYSGGLNIQYSFSHSFGVRVMGRYGTLTGGATYPSLFEKYSFTNTFWEGQAQFVATLGNTSFLRKARKGNLYFAGGLGYMGNDAVSTYTKAGNGGIVYTDKFDEMTPSFSMSLGYRYSFTKSLAIGLEYNFRYTGSDVVDVLNNNSNANKSKDAISMLDLTVSFKLGKKGQEHVEWINPVETIYEDISKIEKKVESLSNDKDGDGVADHFDKDANTPKGAKVYGNGEAVDSDLDGVPDILDEEPSSPKGAKVDSKGKAADADGDGVADVLDMSPNTDTALLVNHQGIPIMTKQLASRMSSKNGGMGGLGYMPAILFETGSANIRPLNYADLSSVAEAIKNAGVTVAIIGNADQRGPEALNDKLALQRAEAVKKVLVENFGLDANKLETKSNGEKVPVAKGSDGLSLQANRRVQFFVVE